jgi:integrase
MSGSLFDGGGTRKYLVARERLAFAQHANAVGGEVGTFCLTLAFTGGRISEVLALTVGRIDMGNGTVVLETLKRRKRGIYRAIPIPPQLIAILDEVHGLQKPNTDPQQRLWRWGRTTAWKRVKAVMQAAKIAEKLATPKAARHAFGVDAVQNSVALNIVQRWMGHARIETTAIYTDVIGREERALARRTWGCLKHIAWK